MTDAHGTESDSLEGGGVSSRNRRRQLLVAGAVAAAGVAAAIWVGLAVSGSESGSDGLSGPGADAAATAALPPERRYTDEELGLDEMIDEHLEPVWAQFRSLSEWDKHREELKHYFTRQAKGHERERMYFERNVRLSCPTSTSTCRPVWGAEEFLTVLARTQWTGAPRREAGPACSSTVFPRPTSSSSRPISACRWMNSWTCVMSARSRAASYPTLDPVVRDELLGRLGEHYRAAVYEYLLEFADAEVPLVDHEGAPRPLEERLINICLKDPGPAQCAAEFRVELPAE